MEMWSGCFWAGHPAALPEGSSWGHAGPVGQQLSLRKLVRNAPFLRNFYTTNDHFSKTGSGQTWGKLSKTGISAGG
jgi:hypothetical protein